jgi:transcriptional regulator with XRE-family HTH domain
MRFTLDGISATRYVWGMWSNWTRTFRAAHSLTQEGAAAMLGVDPRTVRRWEAGQEPTKAARERLSAMLAPSPAHLMGDFLVELLKTSTDYIMLLDNDLRVIANSQSHKRFMQLHHGIDDAVGLSWQKYVPKTYAEWLETRGSTRGMLEDGFVSRRVPYIYTPKVGSEKRPSAGFADHTLLRLASGPVHMTVTRELPREMVSSIGEDVTLIG